MHLKETEGRTRLVPVILSIWQKVVVVVDTFGADP